MPDNDGSSPTGTAARFSRIELPADRIDWAFLDRPPDLPRPLPTEEHPLWVAAQGRLWVPSGAGQPGDAETLLLFDQPSALTALDPPEQLEQRWQQAQHAALAESRRRYLASVPTELLQDDALLGTAVSRLAQPDDIPDQGKALAALGDPHEDASDWMRVVGCARLLALHHKLYDLVTLHEYATVFKKAMGPTITAALAALPQTAAPEDFLVRIEAALDDIHPKARSPLRNKMSTSRVILSGVTLLPIYIGPRSGLYDRYAARLWRSLTHTLLSARAS